MGKANIGHLIRTAPHNVHYKGDLTEQELEIARQLAPSIRQNQRNWIPIYVREISTRNYELVGSPIVLEATKIAEQDVVYGVQIDDLEDTQKQISTGENLLNSSSVTTDRSPSPVVDIIPLIKRVEQLEKQNDRLLEMVEKIHDRFVPDKSLFVNTEEEKSLKEKLSTVSGIGKKKLLIIVADIIKNRPFYSEQEFKNGVTGFHFKSKKKSNNKKPHPKLWENLIEEYDLKFDV